MIGRNVDIVAVGFLLLALGILTTVRQTVWVKVLSEELPFHLQRLDHVIVAVPAVPVQPELPLPPIRYE